MARRVQTGASEEAGTGGVDQGMGALLYLLTLFLSAVKYSLLTDTGKSRPIFVRHLRNTKKISKTIIIADGVSCVHGKAGFSIKNHNI